MTDEAQIAVFSIPNIEPRESHKIAEAIAEILDYHVVIINAPIETVSLEDLKKIVQSLESTVRNENGE